LGRNNETTEFSIREPALAPQTGPPYSFETIDSSSTALIDELVVFFLTGSASSLSIDNINVSAVPIPAAVWLFGSGLLGLVGFARKRA